MTIDADWAVKPQHNSIPIWFQAVLQLAMEVEKYSYDTKKNLWCEITLSVSGHPQCMWSLSVYVVTLSVSDHPQCKWSLSL